jgi:ACS family hexuronate transporter-like MFS transporter
MWFIAVFNVVSDAGCLTVGIATAFLARRGMSVHGSRTLIFVLFALIALVGTSIPFVRSGPLLFAAMLTVGFGVAGMFPCYYAFSQELTRTHQGKVTGTLGAFAWTIPSLWHWQIGRLADATHSYDLGMAVACALPLVGVAALLLVWPSARRPAIDIAPTPTTSGEDLAHAIVPAERVTGVR